ncbi:MAG TPA: hypothetical protein PK340_00260 [Bacilli bacterium]|nr:hypothetical protein [Bacilli bacterium]
MINKATQFILSLYHYSILLRDTLEYTYRRDQYNINVYHARRQALLASLEEKGQIRQIIGKLGENGPKIEAKLHEFIDLVYGSDSTVVRLAGSELRVDHAQHLVLFEMVVGLHQTIWDLVIGYYNAAVGRQETSIDLLPLLQTDERMYRSIVFYTIMGEVEKVFAEFQKAMHESRGEKTPQSNYIVNDLSKLVQLLNFQKVHSKIKDTSFNEMIDENMKVLEMIEGKRELPLMPEAEVNPETKKVGIMINGVRHYTFGDMFAKAREVTRIVLANSETHWKNVYRPINEQLVALSRQTPDGEGNRSLDA